MAQENYSKSKQNQNMLKVLLSLGVSLANGYTISGIRFKLVYPAKC